MVSGDDKAVSEVPLKDLHDFKDHPFKVNDDTEDMKELVESIRQNGVLTAGTVRLRPEGGSADVCGRHLSVKADRYRKHGNLI